MCPEPNVCYALKGDLRGTPVKNCPIKLDVCYGSCWYWSCVAGKCVYPTHGMDIDANLEGDFKPGGND
jgi:hypothetical protein